MFCIYNVQGNVYIILTNILYSCELCTHIIHNHSLAPGQLHNSATASEESLKGGIESVNTKQHQTTTKQEPCAWFNICYATIAITQMWKRLVIEVQFSRPKSKTSPDILIREDTTMQTSVFVSEARGSSHFCETLLIMTDCAIDKSAVTCKWWVNLKMSLSWNPSDPQVYLVFVCVICSSMGATIENILDGKNAEWSNLLCNRNFAPWPLSPKGYCRCLCPSVCTSVRPSVCLFVWACPRDTPQTTICQIFVIMVIPISFRGRIIFFF